MNQLIQLDNQTDKQSNQYYSELLSYVRDHLLAFYQKYAGESGLTLSQTITRVSKWDLEQWKQALDSLGDTGDWPEEAQDRLKIQIYMASINRQQLIGSILALGVIGLTVKNQRSIEKRVKSDGIDEVNHLKQTLKLPSKQAKKATSVITQTSTRKQWSENLWVDSDKLAGDVQYLVNQTLKHGLSLDDLSNLLEKHANPSQFKPGQSIADRAEQMSYETKRLIRSESARMKQQVDLATYRMKGVKWVKWLTEPGACSKCQGIAAGGPYAIDDVPEIPDDSHPNCRCSVVPYNGWPVPMEPLGLRNLEAATAPISKAEKKTLWDKEYGYIQTPNAYDINIALRNSRLDTLNADSRKTVEVLDNLIDSRSSSRTLIATRYLKPDYVSDLINEIRPKSNQEFVTALNSGKYVKQENGFTSVSLSANNLFKNLPVEVTFVLPKGTKMLITDNFIESEAILSRGVTYAIIRARVEDDGRLRMIMKPKGGS